MNRVVNGCHACGFSWTAKTWAHCGECHATFTGVTYFDYHRVKGVCWGQPKLRDSDESAQWEILYEDEGVWSTVEGHQKRWEFVALMQQRARIKPDKAR